MTAPAGAQPEHTALFEEGRGDVAQVEILESWARHTLNWIARWEDEGVGPLHREWSGLALNIGKPLTSPAQLGTFVGVDETMGMLLRDGGKTRLVPLTSLLER